MSAQNAQERAAVDKDFSRYKKLVETVDTVPAYRNFRNEKKGAIPEQ